jgi:hypothetical protein
LSCRLGQSDGHISYVYKYLLVPQNPDRKIAISSASTTSICIPVCCAQHLVRYSLSRSFSHPALQDDSVSWIILGPFGAQSRGPRRWPWDRTWLSIDFGLIVRPSSHRRQTKPGCWMKCGYRSSPSSEGALVGDLAALGNGCRRVNPMPSAFGTWCFVPTWVVTHWLQRISTLGVTA